MDICAQFDVSEIVCCCCNRLPTFTDLAILVAIAYEFSISLITLVLAEKQFDLRVSDIGFEVENEIPTELRKSIPGKV